ncbi:hypothetical protein KIW84_036076 [Lathyrus oleraceus]|uniref:Uncharacterized protein n=1 Tax=Pisum sativum TaxID=3888 RepID=A0A9D4Y790_PEA|nr:hypothetical protein KIW84_036076 [Pisum sativum]
MAHTNEKDSYNAKPPVFDGEKFDYWKDRIESFFLGYDAELWDIVTDGYKPPVTEDGAEVPRSKMSQGSRQRIHNCRPCQKDSQKSAKEMETYGYCSEAVKGSEQY